LKPLGLVLRPEGAAISMAGSSIIVRYEVRHLA